MSILDQLLLLARWKRLILVNTLIVAVASIVVALLLPKSYRAGASIFPPEEDSLSGASLGSLLSATALVGQRANLPVLATPSDLYAAILKSRTLREELIRRFDLQTVYEVENVDYALRQLRETMRVKVGNEGVVMVSFLDRSPERAAELANASIEILDRINREKRHNSARNARLFIEARLEQNRTELAAAEDSLRAIQERGRLLIPQQQAEAVITAAAQVEVQLLMREVELGVLGTQLGPDHPDRLALTREVEGLRARMREMESGQAGDSRFEIPLSQYPGLSLTYVRALRAVKVQEAIFELLTQQHEQFRIQENRDTPTVQVLDRASPPVLKERPIRWLICASATLLAFLVTTAVVAVIELLRRMRVQAPERFAKLVAITREIGLGSVLNRI